MRSHGGGPAETGHSLPGWPPVDLSDETASEKQEKNCIPLTTEGPDRLQCRHMACGACDVAPVAMMMSLLACSAPGRARRRMAQQEVT